MRRRNNCGRSRAWSWIVYDDPAVYFSACLAECAHWAYAYHDKDEGKVPHWHLLLIFRNAKTLAAAKSLSTTTQNIIDQELNSRLSMYRYLTHKDDPDKFQYSDDIVHCDDPEYWNNLSDDVTTTSGEKAQSIIDDILVGVDPYVMAGRYGYHFMLNYSRLKEYAEEVRARRRIDEAKKRADNMILEPVDPDDMPF